jgi:hypothetical protein
MPRFSSAGSVLSSCYRQGPYDDKTKEVLEMKNACIISESVVCRAGYGQCRMFCPRSIYPYWPEVGLERVELHISDFSSSLIHEMNP